MLPTSSLPEPQVYPTQLPETAERRGEGGVSQGSPLLAALRRDSQAAFASPDALCSYLCLAFPRSLSPGLSGSLALFPPSPSLSLASPSPSRAPSLPVSPSRARAGEIAP